MRQVGKTAMAMASGIRSINGEKVKLVLDFKIPSGNKGREQTGILIKEDLKKVGIESQYHPTRMERLHTGYGQERF
jgi:hypothetical protein